MIEPIFLLDSRELWHPVAIETCASVGATLIRHDGTRQPLTPGWETRLPADGGRLDFPRGMTQPEGLPAVGYRRSVLAAGLTWTQYWLFYLYNPKTYVGIGEHEGDWEFVQVASSESAAVLVTGSQHHSGEKREFWGCTLVGTRPLVYVAQGSHANYFSPVSDTTDIANGKGQSLRIEWRDFGPWATWPGRWGNSTGEGKSPESPGRQNPRWSQPHIYHRQARAG